MVVCRDLYGYALSCNAEAAAAFNRGAGDLLRLRAGSERAVAASITLDPTFALGHATLALLGHELCAPVDVRARMRDAVLHSSRATARERSHIQAVAAHLRGDSRPLVRHLAAYPRDAVLLSTAVPTIAFAGVTEVPEEAWRIVESAAPAYGDDWWFTGLLAFVRQEQRRFDEAMELSCRSLAEEPGAGHSAHARAHAHYETGDHHAGLAWMDGWVEGDGASIESLSHFSWHAALHELSLGDLDAVRRRYEAQLRPEHGLGCRALVDSGSLLVRWALTPGATDVPDIAEVAAVAGRGTLERPATPFLGMHAAVALLALGDASGLDRLGSWAAAHRNPAQREVVAPLAQALGQLAAGRCSTAADALKVLRDATWRLGGSDAQREIVEEARIAALLRAGRLDEARSLLDERLDRRHSPRDVRWRDECLSPARGS
ncbi:MULTISPECIES: pyridine nucleotide-disulfide oxidoreductase [unclassified Nocardioides]|uniref:pyridine nucleotide-disulfide oxidoreductase n=1 Tax=unclassified Nocardioides TaxID=2615069 RepID=UPI0009F03FCE|nr:MULTISPECIES: pyridine nucleotide-disulfide oxidoreductase [unclassified Nocardioides]GAW50454.1 FAD-dependent pyridine nucleotide-disulfide oxidoreductase [Nocardioides sp. PD653-B2]GAW53893.1 FAD-dependent pyridine nucleotide-disulfide oxid oreductase [Nocardioides sp. PD653]